MSSRSEDKRELARPVADAQEAAREITHSRTERARVLGEGDRHLWDDDSPVEQQAVQQGARFLAGLTGDTVGAELVEYTDSGTGAEMTKGTKDSAAGKARNHAKD